MSKTFYITTTLPYVNAEPHIGFAMEIIRADIIARYKKLQGYEVFFNTGTDEHGMKIYQKALEAKTDPQKYVDEYAEKFKGLIKLLGLSPDINFIRTTDAHHVKSAQEFWKICKKNGYIYKKNYKIKYCVGCELEKTDSELVDGRCPLHPKLEIETIEEENYFFKFSAFQKQLLEFYGKNPKFVIPDFRFNEIKAFAARGLEDFSISRLKSKMPWGIAVPDDAEHVMYVWFDALVNYISAIGWPHSASTSPKATTGQAEASRGKSDLFEKFWVNGETVQYCGKDNLRQQSAMWQAMLMAAGLPNSKHIIIDGFITGEGGVKMSKSLGNVVSPLEIVNEYGADALRYLVAREFHPFEDSPFALPKFKDVYNANLANGLGNLVSRVMKMAAANGIKFDERAAKDFAASAEADELYKKQIAGFEKFNIQDAANTIWELIKKTDDLIQERQPFKKIKTAREEAEKDIQELLARLDFIGIMLAPILPETSAKIISLVKNSEMPEKPLFKRKE